MFKTFDLLEKMNYVRIHGSKEELKCAEFLASEVEKQGVDAIIEPFEVDGYTIKKATLKSIDPDMVYEVEGVGLSGNTDGVLKGELVYITSLNDAIVTDVSGKIVLYHSIMLQPQIYKELYKKGVKGLILTTGNLYDDNDSFDLDPCPFREKHLEVGSIPAVCVRLQDAVKLLKSNPKFVEMELVQEQYKENSHNVVATIPGVSDEVICFTAHYDSSACSTGMYDNATGSIGILEILHNFKNIKPKYTLKFIWCGSEEVGLLGSKAYCTMHKEELEKYILNVNIDMLAAFIGNDIACCTSEISLVNFIKYFSFEKGFAIMPRQGVYSSDSTSFADCGVPAVSFARIAPPTGARIHSRLDVIDHLDSINYYNSCNFIVSFVERLMNSAAFPVERTIPKNIKEELDFYTQRKQRP